MSRPPATTRTARPPALSRRRRSGCVFHIARGPSAPSPDLHPEAARLLGANARDQGSDPKRSQSRVLETLHRRQSAAVFKRSSGHARRPPGRYEKRPASVLIEVPKPHGRNWPAAGRGLADWGMSGKRHQSPVPLHQLQMPLHATFCHPRAGGDPAQGK